jgi:hypothetical protein
MRVLAILIALLCHLTVSARATPIEVDFKNAETPPNSTQVSLPFLLNNANDTVFLKFKIPDIDMVETINSFDISVSLYDNGDRGGETGTIEFALPDGPNLLLTSFSPNLNGFTAISPDTFTFSLTPDEIAEVFPSILDGNFRIRIQRDSGDFIVGGGTASIDATLAAPEPASLCIVIGGLLAVAGLRRRPTK